MISLLYDPSLLKKMTLLDHVFLGMSSKKYLTRQAAPHQIYVRAFHVSKVSNCILMTCGAIIYSPHPHSRDEACECGSRPGPDAQNPTAERRLKPADLINPIASLEPAPNLMLSSPEPEHQSLIISGE